MARSLFGAMGLLAAGVLVGCGQPVETAKAGKVPNGHVATDGHDHGKGGDHDHGKVAKSAVHDHSGWWCEEHGVPEAECSMCSKKAYKEFQAKGDICDKHPDRAKSQCFICNPALKAEFAKKYKAKEGKEPPEPEGQQEKPAEKK